MLTVNNSRPAPQLKTIPSKVIHIVRQIKLAHNLRLIIDQSTKTIEVYLTSLTPLSTCYDSRYTPTQYTLRKVLTELRDALRPLKQEVYLDPKDLFIIIKEKHCT